MIQTISDNAVLAGQRLAALAVTLRAFASERVSALRGDDRGEGVVSMAIAILIIAFIGAAAWVLFKGVLDGAGSKAKDQINQIGG
jgi:hypothetical protein